MKRWQVIALVILFGLAMILEDGPAVAAMEEQAYCDRVAAGAHTDFKRACK